MLYRTSKCHRHSHPEFQLQAEGVVAPDVEWLIAYLEEAVSNGSVFAADELVQIGWMVTQVTELPGGLLGLFEPDFEVTPIRWVEGVTKTLMHLRVQRDVVTSLTDGSPEFPSIRESAIRGADVDADSQSLLLERVPPRGSDSGWFVGRSDSALDYNSPANLKRVSLYELACTLPPVVPFLALPPGFRVLMNRGTAMYFFDGKAVAPREGTLLTLANQPKSSA